MHAMKTDEQSRSALYLYLRKIKPLGSAVIFVRFSIYGLQVFAKLTDDEGTVLSW